MDWVIGIFIAVGLLFFWGVWIFGYWLPMAKEAQRQFEADAAAEQAAREQRPASAQPPGEQWDGKSQVRQ